MDPLRFRSKEELTRFYHCKKTELSCLVEPRVFLSQLRDHGLVKESVYKKVINMRSKERLQNGVYQMLDWLENEKGDCIVEFWKCVFKDHVLQKYSVLRVLQNNIMDASFNVNKMLPDVEEPSKSEKQSIQKVVKKKGMKRSITKRKENNKEIEEEEEEEEEPSSSTQSTPYKKKPNKKLTFSPIRKADKRNIWTMPLYKASLPITCGDRKGSLHRNKISKGEPCILSNNQWFTPIEFERFAGKGHCRNWKLSIRCEKTSLQKLIEEGHLQVPRQKRRCVLKSQKVLFPASSSESSSSSESLSPRVPIIAEDSGEDEVKLDYEEEEDEEPVDLSMFDDPFLPVTCGSSCGILYKDRFTQKHKKSIRTDERWFTAEEFVQNELTLTDGHWKKDILCHGKTIHYLLMKEILTLHSLLCVCKKCCPEEPENDDLCFICNSEDGCRVCCDKCPRVFHYNCHLPALQDETLRGDWTCTFCKVQMNPCAPQTQENAFNSFVSGNIKHCQCVLLYLYKEDIQRVFVDDPFTTVDDYSRIISNPMWLDRVKAKLQNKKYVIVKEFADDIRLIFENCHNQDNEFGRLGSRLNEVFDQQFKKVFSIYNNSTLST